jgi:D-methionine transport system substrate-binding protein
LQIKPVEFTDYVIPNQALATGEIEANAFQHRPYLNNQIARTGWKQVAVGSDAAAQMDIFSIRYHSLADLPTRGNIAIQNDPTNGARALTLLAANHVLALRNGAGLSALPDVDAAAVNSNYALQAGLDPVNGPIVREAHGRTTR